MDILQEILAADARLQMWYDIALVFGHESLVDARLSNILPVVTLRRLDKQTSDSRLISKHRGKVAVVEWDISVVLAVGPVDKMKKTR